MEDAGKRRHFTADEEGASAIEFALIAPVMLLLLLGTFEMTRAVSAQRQVASMAATVNRLVAGFNVLTAEQLKELNDNNRQPAVTPANLNAVVNASKAVLFPLSIDDERLQITIDRVDLIDGAGVIRWTYDWQTGQGTNSPDDEAADYTPTRNSVIRTRISYTHMPMFSTLLSGIGFDGYTLRGTGIGGGEGDPSTTIEFSDD
jgi:Flp pilus assembly protein TadG